jgi:hypothetical protein
MREVALEIVRTLGYNDPDDWPTQQGWLIDNQSLLRVNRAVRAGDAGWAATGEGMNAPLHFWVRREPAGFEPRVPSNEVWTDYPVRRNPGSVLVQLDQNRNLKRFVRMPNQADPDPDPTEPDWAAPFELAGLDYQAFEPIDAVNTPGTDPIVQRAWEGPAPADSIDDTPLRLRVYAGARDGLITDFVVEHAPTPPAETAETAEPTPDDGAARDQPDDGGARPVDAGRCRRHGEAARPRPRTDHANRESSIAAPRRPRTPRADSRSLCPGRLPVDPPRDDHRSGPACSPTGTSASSAPTSAAPPASASRCSC